MFIKQIIASIFLLAFAMQVFNKSFVVYDYYANTQAYAKNCENKAKPKMHCNGKCQMMKKLQQEEKKDQQNQERKGENKIQITLSSKSFFANITSIFKPQSKLSYPFFDDSKEIKVSQPIFRPPIFC